MNYPTPERVRARVQRAIARLGVKLIHHSGIAKGYWSPWRSQLFDYAQEHELHILPVHYYSPIPDTRRATHPDAPLFAEQINYNADRASDMLNEFRARFASEFDELSTRTEPLKDRFTFAGSPYHPGEAEVLYAMVRTQQPRQIIEIGCGFSTLIIAEAIADEQGNDPDYRCNYSCVEPYRPDYLADPPEQVTEFIDEPVQALSPERVAQLNAGDILFIDSTHVVGFQSDVVHEILRLLPALKPGVLVHIHDIFLPYEYPQRWIDDSRFFWTEQYLLYAYMLSNPHIEVLLPLHHLYRQRPDQMKKLFPSMSIAKMEPSAIWLRTC